MGHFSIDSRSGDVKVTEQFSLNPQISYTLKVVAIDSGSVPLEETAVVHIQVILCHCLCLKCILSDLGLKCLLK